MLPGAGQFRHWLNSQESNEMRNVSDETQLNSAQDDSVFFC